MQILRQVMTRQSTWSVISNTLLPITPVRSTTGLLRNGSTLTQRHSLCLTRPVYVNSYRHFSSGTDGSGSGSVRPEFPPIVPKKLGDVVRLELFKDRNSEEIREIWQSYFTQPEVVGYVGTYLNATAWDLLKQRMAKCPMFVYPVQNVEEKLLFFTLYAEWNKTDNQCRMAFLEDFRNDPASAQTYFHLYPHLQFLKDRDTVLLQAEYLPYLSKQQGAEVLDACMSFYLEDEKYQHVETFNLDPDRFDFAAAFQR